MYFACEWSILDSAKLPLPLFQSPQLYVVWGALNGFDGCHLLHLGFPLFHSSQSGQPSFETCSWMVVFLIGTDAQNCLALS